MQKVSIYCASIGPVSKLQFFFVLHLTFCKGSSKSRFYLLGHIIAHTPLLPGWDKVRWQESSLRTSWLVLPPSSSNRLTHPHFNRQKGTTWGFQSSWNKIFIRNDEGESSHSTSDHVQYFWFQEGNSSRYQTDSFGLDQTSETSETKVKTAANKRRGELR